MNRLSDAVPSAYLTLWSTSALLLGTKVRAQVLELQPEFPEDINQLLEKISRWATATLERNIAGRSAKIVGHFDVIECLCAACIVATLNRRLPRKPRDGTLQLAEHAIGLLLDNYFDEGSFRISRPVFSDANHNTVLCSTAEALFYVLCSFPKEAKLRIFRERDRWRMLGEIAKWAADNHTPDGYPPDVDAAFSPDPLPNLFASAVTLGFLKRAEEFLDDLSDDVARTDLAIGDPDQPGAWDHIDYPEKLKRILDEALFFRLRDPAQQKFARRSFIFHGPPGTAKTSLSRKIAGDLSWSFKVVTQSDFLRSGKDKIRHRSRKDVRDVCLPQECRDFV